MHAQLRVRVSFGHSNVGDDVTSVRWRVLGPGHAGLQASDAPFERLLGLIEDGYLVLARKLSFDTMIGIDQCYGLAGGTVAPAHRGHPIADVIGEETQPLAELPLVEQ